jgi:hypothetical protein
MELELASREKYTSLAREPPIYTSIDRSACCQCEVLEIETGGSKGGNCSADLMVACHH